MLHLRVKIRASRRLAFLTNQQCKSQTTASSGRTVNGNEIGIKYLNAGTTVHEVRRAFFRTSSVTFEPDVTSWCSVRGDTENRLWSEATAWVFISPYAAAYCPIYEGWFGKRCRYRVKRSVHSNYRFTLRKIITNFTPECGQQSSNFRDASNGTCCRFGDNIIVNSSFLAVNDGWSVVSLSRMKKVNFRV
jgi:hypothetical protein